MESTITQSLKTGIIIVSQEFLRGKSPRILQEISQKMPLGIVTQIFKRLPLVIFPGFPLQTSLRILPEISPAILEFPLKFREILQDVYIFSEIFSKKPYNFCRDFCTMNFPQRTQLKFLRIYLSEFLQEFHMKFFRNSSKNFLTDTSRNCLTIVSMNFS